MTLPDESSAADVAAADDKIDVPAVDLANAQALAAAVLRTARGPVVVRVATPQQLLLHLAQAGTTRFNEVAVERKVETVFALGRSTLWWHLRLAEQAMSIDAHPFVDERRYTDIAGGIPLRIGGRVAGALAVSGLAPRDDHEVAMAATRSLSAHAP